MVTSAAPLLLTTSRASREARPPLNVSVNGPPALPVTVTTGADAGAPSTNVLVVAVAGVLLAIWSMIFRKLTAAPLKMTE